MLKRVLGKINQNELIKGSITLFIMINIFNALNWLFHFVMLGLLGITEYGILSVLMSFVYVFSVPSEAIQTIVAKYTSKFNLKKELGKIKFLLNTSLKKCSKAALLFFAIFMVASIFLKSFLKIDFWLLAINGLILLSCFLLPVTRGVLQGRKKFVSLGTNMIAESVLKISLAILLVLIGLGTYGAIGGVAIGIFLAFFVSFLVIKEILKVKRQKANLRGISSYSFSVTLVILAIVLMYSLDIILARGFLPAEAAGEYAAISMLGKIIFFGTLPMSKAMFPISSEKFESGKETSRIFKKSLTIVILLCLLALLAFILIPGFIVKVWTHGKILNTPLIVLFFVGLALSLLSLTNLIVMYCFSINRIKNTWWLFLFVLLEVVLLAIFHSSVMQFSLAFLAANVLMFLNSLLIIKTS